MKQTIHLFTGLFLVLLATGYSNGKNFPDRLPKGEDIPILAWYSVPAEEIKPERFQELREAGFHLSFRGYPSVEDVLKALDAANGTGVKVIAACPELTHKGSEERKKAVERLKDHPSLAGYFLIDEPVTSQFGQLAQWAQEIEAIDNSHYCYLNLFPTGPEQHLTALGVSSYEEYVRRFIEEVGLKFVSFDCYPVVRDENSNKILKPEWYYNLEVIAAEAKRAGQDFWAFSMATAHIRYPVATKESLRLQMWSNLVYGAQTLQYFTYWTPSNADFYYFAGPIERDGSRTEVYDYIKQMNKEIQDLSYVFSGAKVLGTYHTGEKIPDGTMRLKELPNEIKLLETTGEGAVVSILENNGYTFLAIVNRDINNSTGITIKTKGNIRKINKDGSLSLSKGKDSYSIEPGDIVVYMW